MSKNSQLEIKKQFNLEHLHFYHKNNTFHCSYISNPDDFFPILNNQILWFFLNSLSMKQGIVYFDDIGEYCHGIDELREKYLLFVLAGL